MKMRQLEGREMEKNGVDDDDDDDEGDECKLAVFC